MSRGRVAKPSPASGRGLGECPGDETRTRPGIRAISPHARRLRQDMTDAERALWLELRDRRLLGFKFRRQWTLGSYVVDFCCIERRLIIEADGGQHTPERDARRTAWLTQEGYRVLRFWNNEILTNMGGVLETIGEALASDPHPNPLPQAGEGK